jgi:hypothetical protein
MNNIPIMIKNIPPNQADDCHTFGKIKGDPAKAFKACSVIPASFIYSRAVKKNARGNNVKKMATNAQNVL